MPPFFIRSTIFNICFYVLTGISCVLLLPTLILPRKVYFVVVHGFVYTTAFLEKYILGLSYEVRGREHVPQTGAYIVAAKHQSAYETFKLHILFKDPAIVLKKELLKIPLWGQYLAKSDVIAIDRSSPKIAIKSIQDGAKRVAAQGREIIIFPQGTRVKPETTTAERPYKIGIVRIQEATQIPILPLAMNTGIFYPKGSWCKKPGKVVFEFLPPIMPDSNRNAGEILKELETAVEGRSKQLMEEGLHSIPKRKSAAIKIFTYITIIACLAYIANWIFVADLIKKSSANIIHNLNQNRAITHLEVTPPIISGFPGKMHINLPKQRIKTRYEDLIINATHAQGWPFLGLPIDIKMSDITLSYSHWASPLAFESLDARLTYWSDIITLTQTNLQSEATQGQVIGTIDLNNPPYPDLDLVIKIKGHEMFMQKLVQQRIVKENAAMIASFALAALKRDGEVVTTITSQDNKVYLGPIKVIDLPKVRVVAP